MTNDVLPAADAPRWRRAVAAARAALPRGGALSEQNWSDRHRGICLLLWAHVVVLPLIALWRDESVTTALFEANVLTLFAACATLARLRPIVRSSLATMGLITSSAILVHNFDGLIEMHFHFFVIVAVIALYQSWRPFLLALAFVVFHHAVIGTLSPEDVYNHGSAQHNPALFALIHGGFIFAESVACVVYWRVSEASLDSERAARVQLEKAHGDLAQAQELAAMGSWDLDYSSGTLTWSDQLYALAGVDPQSFTPTTESFLDLVHPDDHARIAELTSAAVEAMNPLNFECRLVRPDKTTRTVHALGEWVTDSEGAATGMFGTLHDVTERMQLQAEIEHLAFHDPLTGLANRRLFMDRLVHALAITERSGRSCAVLFLDLDGFKKINDTCGHSVGDDLLCEVARRLTRAARGMDTIARLGGDEFALLCEGIDLDTAIQVAGRIDEQLNQPVDLQGTKVILRGSIGIALAEGSFSTESILREADAAMYSVKSARKKALAQGVPGETAGV